MASPGGGDSGYRRASLYSLTADSTPSYGYLLFAHGIALLPALGFIVLFGCLSLRIHCHLPNIGLSQLDVDQRDSHPNVSRCSALLGAHSSLSWSLFALAIAAYTAAHKLRSLLSHFSSLLFHLVQDLLRSLPSFSSSSQEQDLAQNDEKVDTILACIVKAIFSEFFKASLIVSGCAITIAKVHVDAVAAERYGSGSMSGVGYPMALDQPVFTNTNRIDLLDQIRWSMLDPQEASFRVVVWIALGWSIADFTRGTIQLYRHLAMYAPVYLPEDGLPEDEDVEALGFWNSQDPQSSVDATASTPSNGRQTSSAMQSSKGVFASGSSQGRSPLTQSVSDQLPLTLPEYERYGRQMILPSFGLEGQLKLSKAKVLVIGAGGLGCPAVQYLAAAGVGSLSVVDHDVVERSNLARQILHTEERIGMSKARSIQEAVKDINPHVTVTPIVEALNASNAFSLITAHDVILDCTDNPLTRYLINDAAVLSDKVVVSGAAQGYEGQVMLLHRHLPSRNRGPCYRCVFPSSPKPSEVTNCEDSGVLGTVTGLVGTLQAMETIKLVVGLGDKDDERPTMLLVSPLSSTPFRTIKIRPRREDCVVCGAEGDGSRKIRSLQDEDYVAFCGLNTIDKDGQQSNGSKEVTVQQLAKSHRKPDLLVDVRTTEEFSIVKLPNSTNLPYSDIRRDSRHALSTIEALLPPSSSPSGDRFLVHLVCTRGNDSRLAAKLLTEASQEEGGRAIDFVNVRGGLRAWQQEIDEYLPNYWGGSGGGRGGGGGGSSSPELRKRIKATMMQSAPPRANSTFLVSSSSLAPLFSGKAYLPSSRADDDGLSSSSISTTSSSAESELSMIAHLEDQIDRLVAARTRVKLEQSLGASLPELPSPLAALWRLDAALWCIGSLLLLSSSLALSQGPLFSLDPPRRHAGPPILFPPIGTLWPTYLTLAALHAISDSIWRLALPVFGWAAVTYGSLLVGIGMMLVGLARWGLVV